ncbi:hypothetical protein DL96DRAFT_1621912 [Flagelloscypha sp. PMI_526]|nr:hypothetical protein DL96DRAFT_1621912 [Flagelloscypha sp. PMI_526]
MDLQSIPSLSVSQTLCVHCCNTNTALILCGKCGDSLPLSVKHTPLQHEETQVINSPLEQMALREQLRLVDAQTLAMRNLISHLSNSCDALESWARLQRRKLAPIETIPLEILQIIMDFAVEKNVVTRRMDALVISHVSSRWRALARSTSRLWSHIHFHRCSNDADYDVHGAYKRLRRCLKLAKGQLLDIEILETGENGESDNIVQLGREIAERSHQWRSLTIDIEAYQAFWRYEIQANHLQELRLTHEDTWAEPYIPSLVNNAPALRILDMSGVAIRVSTSGPNRVPLNQLEEFKGRINWNDCDGISLPTMTALVVLIDAEDILDSTDSKLHLPHVQHLTLGFDSTIDWANASHAFDVDAIFRRFLCPDLPSLTLSYASITTDTCTSLRSMLVGKRATSTLQALHLNNCQVTSSSLQSFLALLPNLTQFSFIHDSLHEAPSPLDQATYAWMLNGGLVPRLANLYIEERCSDWDTSGLFFFLHSRLSVLQSVTLCGSVSQVPATADQVDSVTAAVQVLRKRGLDISFYLKLCIGT